MSFLQDQLWFVESDLNSRMRILAGSSVGKSFHWECRFKLVSVAAGKISIPLQFKSKIRKTTGTAISYRRDYCFSRWSNDIMDAIGEARPAMNKRSKWVAFSAILVVLALIFLSTLQSNTARKLPTGSTRPSM